MDTIISMLIEILVGVITIAVCRYLVPLLKGKSDLVKSEEAKFWIDQIVKLAEQTLGTHCGTGEAKRELVEQISKEILPYLDDYKRNVLIEAAVKALRIEAGEYEQEAS